MQENQTAVPSDAQSESGAEILNTVVENCAQTDSEGVKSAARKNFSQIILPRRAFRT